MSARVCSNCRHCGFVFQSVPFCGCPAIQALSAQVEAAIGTKRGALVVVKHGDAERCQKFEAREAKP